MLHAAPCFCFSHFFLFSLKKRNSNLNSSTTQRRFLYKLEQSKGIPLTIFRLRRCRRRNPSTPKDTSRGEHARGSTQPQVRPRHQSPLFLASWRWRMPPSPALLLDGGALWPASLEAATGGDRSKEAVGSGRPDGGRVAIRARGRCSCGGRGDGQTQKCFREELDGWEQLRVACSTVNEIVDDGNTSLTLT